MLRESILNCRAYDLATFTCLDCLPGYRLNDNNICVSLPPNCANVNEAGECIACAPGFTLIGRNCIRSIQASRAVIDRVEDKYIAEFGLVPTFKAGLHCGTAIRGEIGVVKSEIAYYGDVVNTTSRIMSHSSSLNRTLLLSEKLAKQLPEIDGFSPVELQRIELKGKKEFVTIYG